MGLMAAPQCLVFVALGCARARLSYEPRQLFVTNR